MSGVPAIERADRCCIACDRHKTDENGWPFTVTMMYLCPECGNKRCPKASDHRNACTGSNDPGQAGSVYQYDV